MARIRTVKPELFDDPDIGRLSPLSRWLFVGLFTQADRRGRLEDNPARLRLRLLGFDPKADVGALLDELHGAGLILRYKVDSHAFIQVRSFEKHQRPHHAEPESQIPAYSSENGKKPGETGKNPAETVVAPAETVNLRLSPLDTGYLILDTGECVDGFSRFQALYPKGPNVGTFKHAAKAWARLTPDQRTAALTALPIYAVSDGATKDGGRFVPTPQKWLADEWWLKVSPTARLTDAELGRKVTCVLCDKTYTAYDGAGMIPKPRDERGHICAVCDRAELERQWADPNRPRFSERSA